MQSVRHRHWASRRRSPSLSRKTHPASACSGRWASATGAAFRRGDARWHSPRAADSRSAAMNAELSPAGGPVFRIYRARPADVADLHGLVRALADHERLGGLCTSTPDDLADALFGRLPAAEALIAILMGILSFMSDFVGFGLFFILTRHSSAAGASGSKMFSCGRSTVVSGSCGNCSRRLRVSPASGAATASNGPCSTRSVGAVAFSMNRSGERCCRTGRSRALPSRRSRASPNHPGGGSPARTRVSRRLAS